MEANVLGPASLTSGSSQGWQESWWPCTQAPSQAAGRRAFPSEVPSMFFDVDDNLGFSKPSKLGSVTVSGDNFSRKIILEIHAGILKWKINISKEA